MRRKPLWLPFLMLLCLLPLSGCGGRGEQNGTAGAAGTTNPPAPSVSIVSNWQFSTTSTIPATPPVTIAGSINQSGGKVSGTVHVQGSSCFDWLTAVALAGTLIGDNLSMTSATGQITFTGSVTNDALSQQFTSGEFTGTYTIAGDCANPHEGTITGSKVPYVPNLLNGTFTGSAGGMFDLTGDVGQDAGASAEGSFGVSGTATINTACFGSGTITAGTFPSGSYIIGTSVSLEIVTGNGTLAFLGTLDTVTGNISGKYSISGGTCDQTGTAVLATSSPWDY
jgi:hypothetical protein